VEEIASSGLLHGALYSNFESKEDLFLALMEREIDVHSRDRGAVRRVLRQRSRHGGARAG